MERFNHSCTLRLNDTLKNFLDEESERKNISVQSVIRLAITDMMEQEKKKQKEETE